MLAELEPARRDARRGFPRGAAVSDHDADRFHAAATRVGEADRPHRTARDRGAHRRVGEHGHARCTVERDQCHQARRVARAAAGDEILGTVGEASAGDFRGVFRTARRGRECGDERERHDHRGTRPRGRERSERGARQCAAAAQSPEGRAALHRRRLESRLVAGERGDAVSGARRAGVRGFGRERNAVARFGFAACCRARVWAVGRADFHSVQDSKPSAARGADDGDAARGRVGRGAEGDCDSGVRAVSGHAGLAAAHDGREDAHVAPAGAAGRIAERQQRAGIPHRHPRREAARAGRRVAAALGVSLPAQRART